MAAMPSFTRGLRHVALKCKDLGAMEHFYTDLLGYEVEWRPDPENVYLTNGADSLALHVDAGANVDETRLDHVGILLAKEDDVELWAAHLEKEGATLVTKPKTHRDGCRSFYALDPEGTKIQFLWHPVLSPASA
jgi:catechol-2,3-dioxygenase